MQRRSGEALQRDRHRRRKPLITPTDVGTVGDFESALSEGAGDIRLTADLALSSPYTVSSDTILDLNSNGITFNQNGSLFTVDGGKLTVTGNGTVSTKGRMAIARNGGEVVIENGMFESETSDVIRVENGTAIINGGDLTGREGAVTGREGSSTIVINGGNLTGTDNFAVCTNGTEGMGNNTITINGGRLEGNIKSAGYEAIGVYIANSDTFVMNDGEIIANGGTGLCMRGGNVTINGGTITATNVDKNGNIVADGKIGDDPTVMTGCSAVIYHESANYPGKEGMKLTITGGTITGVDHSVQVLSNEAQPQVFVTGGTLTPAYPEG